MNSGMERGMTRRAKPSIIFLFSLSKFRISTYPNFNFPQESQSKCCTIISYHGLSSPASPTSSSVPCLFYSLAIPPFLFKLMPLINPFLRFRFCEYALGDYYLPPLLSGIFSFSCAITSFLPRLLTYFCSSFFSSFFSFNISHTHTHTHILSLFSPRPSFQL